MKAYDTATIGREFETTGIDAIVVHAAYDAANWMYYNAGYSKSDPEARADQMRDRLSIDCAMMSREQFEAAVKAAVAMTDAMVAMLTITDPNQDRAE